MSAFDTMSLSSDTTPGAQVVWAGGACGGLVYESVDELHVAVESLRRLHAELQEEAETLTARVEESRAAEAAARTAGGGSSSDSGDPVVCRLLSAAETWMMLSRTAVLGEGQAQDRGGGESSSSLSLALPASAGGPCDSNSGRGGSPQSGLRNRRKTPGSGSSRSKKGKAAGGRIGTASGRGGGAPEEQDQPGPQQASVVGRDGSSGGTLAAATKTPLQRRELFYHLVDDFRDYQTGGRSQQRTAAVTGGAGVDGEESVNQRTRAEGNGGGSELPPIGVSSVGGDGGGGGGGGDCAGASASDNYSVSVRTLCDFGPPECRNASTQTIAKVGANAVNYSQMPGALPMLTGWSKWPQLQLVISTTCIAVRAWHQACEPCMYDAVDPPPRLQVA